MVKRITIAIDGPSGAGKSTIAKKIAKTLGYALVDTGAIYRTIALLALEKDISLDDENSIVPLCDTLPISFQWKEEENCIYLGEKDISALIRTPEVSRGAALVSRHPKVRAALLGLQRHFAHQKGAVLEGRDIGTVVCPDAELKFFLTASTEARAKRRHLELLQAGHEVTLEDTKRDVEQRDLSDTSRAAAPLRQAEDAVLIDASVLSIDQVLSCMFQHIQQATTL